MEANWGYRRMSRSLCVPLPTPGAPTNIIRAASLSFLLPLETPILLEKPSGRRGTCRTAEAEKVGEEPSNWTDNAHGKSAEAPGCGLGPHGAHRGLGIEVDALTEHRGKRRNWPQDRSEESVVGIERALGGLENN